ncbi:chaplin [Streptomyces sp. NPDC053780]|uniref:chaplin n=1 Tax=unclassified Streptomyces TaxID=2593676 RepID=UPI000F746FB4|nr:chaplin [Streptomyces sp. WAC 04229]RSN44258.1 chaplin [Streptomyces sp. WAC 04229]
MSRIAKAAGVALGAGAVVLSGTGLAMADAGAEGAAIGSPGVLSGNVIQVPVHVPVNLCGNTVNILALLNPAFGNACENGADDKKDTSDKKKDTSDKNGKKHGKKNVGYGG